MVELINKFCPNINDPEGCRLFRGIPRGQTLLASQSYYDNTGKHNGNLDPNWVNYEWYCNRCQLHFQADVMEIKAAEYKPGN